MLSAKVSAILSSGRWVKAQIHPKAVRNKSLYAWAHIMYSAESLSVDPVKCRLSLLCIYFCGLIWFMYPYLSGLPHWVRLNGPHLNIKTIFPKYGDSHVKDRTVTRLSYLQHGDPYTRKMTSLYWDGPQVSIIDKKEECCAYTVYMLNINSLMQSDVYIHQ